ncbi:MAG: hydrogenase maturation nickel metallochaperone HypA [Terracidiphilus sp.]|jgi:hydrogenase nickel incorporation protein HypA/HybF
MHELSIVASVVDSVTESLAPYPGARVEEVRLRVGVLAAVVVDSLEFCWGLATADTSLEGSRLVVKMMPVVMHCVPCAADVELEGVQSFRCALCGEPCSDLRQGRELEIESIEIEEAAGLETNDPETDNPETAGPESAGPEPVSRGKTGVAR